MSKITNDAQQFRPLPSQPPPSNTVGPVHWVRENLLSSRFNIIMTVATLYLLFSTVPGILDWVILSANFSGSTQNDCTGSGACWVFVGQWMDSFLYGRYPREEIWRINVGYLVLLFWVVPQFVNGIPYRGYLMAFGLTGFPVVGYLLLSGDLIGLTPVETDLWGGFTLNLLLAYVGIVASLPIGVILALGRQSDMPVVRSLCVAFIELWRGVPLITILFMASVMLPLFLPAGTDIDKVLRAMVGIALFQSAYMAEVIRGGLQALPKGQTEAAQALGLGYWQSMRLIILPQAIRIVIPGIVNTFIALFKDTTLVGLIGLFEILRVVQASIIDPAWGSVATEGYLFEAAMFWIFCFGMSRYSQNLEKKLHTGHKTR